MDPNKYPSPEKNAKVNLSFQVFDSTKNPTKGSDKNGPMKAKNNIPG